MAGPTCQVTHLKGTAYVVELQLYASTLLFGPLQPKIGCILLVNQRVILDSCINATLLLPVKDRSTAGSSDFCNVGGCAACGARKPSGV
jgi:hypothetical protein